MTLKIQWLSDRITGGFSAYSKITYECCTRLAKDGYKVSHIPMGRANRMGKQVFKDILVYGSGNDPWGEDVAIHHYIDWKADMLITLKEPWVFQHVHNYALNYVPYAIIDHSPVSQSIVSRLRYAFRVLAPSRFAQRELKEAKVENVTYVPHGVRTDIYKPLEGRKSDCKKLWFVDPDDFTVLIVAMNRSRKMIPHQLRGYKRFLELNPDVKSHLMLWSDIQPVGRDMNEGAIGMGVADVGVNLLPEIVSLGITEEVMWPDKNMISDGIPEWGGENYVGGWDMVKLYNMADALLLCSGGEAAGLPYLESLACGVMPIGTDYAGAPEYIGPGLTVKPEDYVIINTPGVKRMIPSIDGIANALTKIMNSNSEKNAKKAVRFAKRYSWENIMEKYFKPFLEEAETELKPLLKKGGAETW